MNVKIFKNLIGWMKSWYCIFCYEDLVVYLMEILRGVYKMVGFVMVNSIFEWIEFYIIEKRGKFYYSYLIKRNFKVIVDNWCFEIDFCVVNIIENSCCFVLKLFGYKFVNGLE